MKWKEDFGFGTKSDGNQQIKITAVQIVFSFLLELDG